jgi:hypothetical protein
LAAKLLGHTGDITRFPSRDHFASYTGTAPVEASSGRRAPPSPEPRRQPPAQHRPAPHRRLPDPRPQPKTCVLPAQTRPERLLARAAGPRQPSGGFEPSLAWLRYACSSHGRSTYLRSSCIGRDHLMTGPALRSPRWCGPTADPAGRHPMRPGRGPFAATHRLMATRQDRMQNSCVQELYV